MFSINSEGLKLCQSIDTAAVLDQKWCHVPLNGFSVLGVVNAVGNVELYKLLPTHLKLELLSTYKIECEETLILSLDWSTGIYSSAKPDIICSDSKGNIRLLTFCNDKLLFENMWSGHEFEAWIAGFYYFDTNIFFSGKK